MVLRGVGWGKCEYLTCDSASQEQDPVHGVAAAAVVAEAVLAVAMVAVEVAQVPPKAFVANAGWKDGRSPPPKYQTIDARLRLSDPQAAVIAGD